MKKLFGILFLTLVVGLGTSFAQTPMPYDSMNTKKNVQRDTMIVPMNNMPRDTMNGMQKNGLKNKNKIYKDNMPMNKNKIKPDSTISPQ